MTCPTFPMAQPLSNQVALVTGAARRIGRTIALRLASEGAQVAIHYRRFETEARQTAEECGAKIFQADLTQMSELQRLYRQIEDTYGRLDCLVNNAARYREMDVLELTEDDWDEIHDINLKAVFFSCQSAAKLMQKGTGGRIVNISSLGGIRPWTRHVPYCASKAGVIHMTRALAKALAPKVSVNTVAPGVIHFDAEMPPKVQRLVSVTPMRRPGSAEEVAEAVVHFLAGSKFVTGQLLAVDGGLSQRA